MTTYRELRKGDTFRWTAHPGGNHYEKTGTFTYRLIRWQDGTPVPGMSYNCREGGSRYSGCGPDADVTRTTYGAGAPPASAVMDAADVVDALATSFLGMPPRWGLDLGGAALDIARPPVARQ